ncbi:hypothetical protein EHS25_003161 [Saitozyma podzolica]|uniref:JmjC domain-containing protein n=1 Tax=Saitozyma podzolica TaxID=1890683 RepID=A0A427Y825_9TREE|nr:hypothetical protein EHS25_003161 [Saitozyma podzolica]
MKPSRSLAGLQPFASASFARPTSLPHPTPAQIRSHLATSSPTALHLPDLVSAWPALRSWTLEDGLAPLREAVGEDMGVDIEMGPRGRGYLDERYRRVTMGFGLFLDAFILNRIPSTTDTATGPTLPTAYLAQSDLPPHPIFDRDTPSLPHFSCGPRGEVYRRTLWVGPGGSFTPFHRDPYIGIYSQIIGTKTFHILPPEAERLLDINPRPPHTNTSQIPISVSALFGSASPPTAGHPAPPPEPESNAETLSQYRAALAEASKLPGACEARLGPGESLLVPEGWWHSAEGIETGVGINAWFR